MTANQDPLAAIDIRHITKVEYLEPKQIKIVLSDTTKSYLLQASSDDNAKLWVANLIKRREALLDALKEFSPNPNNPDSTTEEGRPRSGSSIDVKDRTLTEKTLATVTDAELLALSSIKQQFVSEGFKVPDSALCLRFLRARKGNVPDAIDFLRQHLEWRRSTFPIKYDEIKEELEKGKYVLRGLDRDGDVIIYIRGCLLGPDKYSSLENHMRQVSDNSVSSPLLHSNNSVRSSLRYFICSSVSGQKC